MRFARACLVVVFVSGCSMPVKTRIVGNSTDAVDGQRYLLRSPGAPTASLQVACLDTAEDPATKATNANIGLSITIDQKVDGPGTIYEIKPTSKIFATTDVTISTGDDDRLTAFSAGSQDKTLDFVKAAATVAVTAAAAAGAPGLPPADLDLTAYKTMPQEVQDFINRQYHVTRSLKAAKDALNTKLLDPTAKPDDLKGIQARIDALETAKKETLPLKSSWIDISFGAASPGPAKPKWLTLTLTAN